MKIIKDDDCKGDYDHHCNINDHRMMMTIIDDIITTIVLFTMTMMITIIMIDMMTKMSAFDNILMVHAVQKPFF